MRYPRAALLAVLLLPLAARADADTLARQVRQAWNKGERARAVKLADQAIAAAPKDASEPGVRRVDKARVLYCADRKTGKLLWEKTAVVSNLESKHAENSWASSTPAADGERVYVTFLDKPRMRVYCYDYDGNNENVLAEVVRADIELPIETRRAVPRLLVELRLRHFAVQIRIPRH